MSWLMIFFAVAILLSSLGSWITSILTYVSLLRKPIAFGVQVPIDQVPEVSAKIAGRIAERRGDETREPRPNRRRRQDPMLEELSQFEQPWGAGGPQP